MIFWGNKNSKLQEVQDAIYRNVPALLTTEDVREYFEIYLGLMGKHSGNIAMQLQIAAIFEKFLETFGTENHDAENVSERRFIAKRALLDIRNGYKTEWSD